MRAAINLRVGRVRGRKRERLRAASNSSRRPAGSAPLADVARVAPQAQPSSSGFGLVAARSSSMSAAPSPSLSTWSRARASRAGATLSAEALRPRVRIDVPNGVFTGPTGSPGA
jgi:hypothetical protein